jgi:hypothetical protein
LEYSDDVKKLAEEGIYLRIAIDNVRPLGSYSNYTGYSTRDNGKNILKWDTDWSLNLHEMAGNYGLNFEIIKTKRLEQLT